MTIQVRNGAGGLATISTIDDLMLIAATAEGQEALQTAVEEITAKLPANGATEAKQETVIAALASILTKIIVAPATEAKQDTTLAAINLVGTRAYGPVERVGVATASAQSAAIAATEILLHASTKCYVLAGASPTATAATGIPLEAGEKFHMRITSGHKVAVIRDAADGFLHIATVS